MILIFQKSKLLCLQKTQVQIQSWKQICDRTKIRSLVKHGTLGVEHVLEQWKEKLRFLLRLRDHQRVDSHSFFTTLKVTKKPTSLKPSNHHDSKRLSLLHCSQSTLSNSDFKWPSKFHEEFGLIKLMSKIFTDSHMIRISSLAANCLLIPRTPGSVSPKINLCSSTDPICHLYSPV